MPSTPRDVINGISTSVAVKAPVKAVSSSSLSLSGLQTVGGVSLAAKDRVLVKNQINAVDNGIYLAATGAWQRSADFNGVRDVVRGTLVLVENTAQVYRVESDDSPILIGISEITFVIAVPLSSTIPFVSITDFGAVAGGDITTNTSALESAVTASSFVFVPPSTTTYQINDEITLPDGVFIFGAGWFSSLTQTVAGKNVLIAGDSNTIENLRLVGKTPGNNLDLTKQNGVYASGVRNLKVLGCFMHGFDNGCGVQVRDCKGVHIEGNVIFANPWGNGTPVAGPGASAADILLYSSVSGARVNIKNNGCYSNNSQGIYVDALGADADILIGGNICETLDPATCVLEGTWSELGSADIDRRHGIVVGYVSSSVDGPRAIIEGNICRNTNWTGIYKQGISGGSISICNNQCSNNGYTAANSLSGGIYINVSGHENVYGNVIEGFQQAANAVGGITLNAATSPTNFSHISDNIIKGSAGNGIAAGTNSALVVIENNLIENSGFSDIYIANAASAGVGGFTISKNKIVRFSGSAIPGITYSQGATTTLQARIVDNDIKGFDNSTSNVSNVGIRCLNQSSLVEIENNRIDYFYYGINWNTYWSVGRHFEAVIARNIISNCNTGIAIASNVNTCVVPLVDNAYHNCAVNNAATYLSGFKAGYDAQKRGSKLIVFQAAVPTIGNWILGDRVEYDEPAAGTSPGAVCTTAGATGSFAFKVMAAIAA